MLKRLQRTTKRFSLLWFRVAVKRVLTCFSADMVRERTFDRGTSLVKHVQACLCTTKGVESSFDRDGGHASMSEHLERSTKQFFLLWRRFKVRTDLNAEMVGESSFDCGASPVELVVASSRAGKALESTFDRSGGPMKLVHACLSTGKDLGSSLHHDGSPVKLKQTCMFKRLQRSTSNFHYCGGAVKCVLL